ncbi:unnamed protein product [Brachionus calyciflorus]|uniref:Uncharacterized protein n=1 Tax=Brachionus calyciflorus TaxID=104777 RepID=A0A813V4J9_9BILA|nr:unnamed protein product [Brachionus calyciflorus]
MIEAVSIRDWFDCFNYCSLKITCKFVMNKNANCRYFSSLSMDEEIYDGSYWYKNKVYPKLAKNYSITYLQEKKFIKVYDVLYSYITIQSDLDNIKNKCNINSILCAGGGLVGSDVLDLVACANCYSVLTPTEKNKPVLIEEVYWYMTPDHSFGFSPNATIDQNSADIFDTTNPFRLSWHLNISFGGYRLGQLTGLNNDNNYKKYIFIKV